ncbi:alpha/beta hydrolase [Anabaena subtropica]|uniref:Alpha/beta hydrolase n=1 Tax=Anabaena subtropica FACHB-260 TaxID=2692884 RepID=A0ABR8CRH1_9NOST|nr:alpha/beta hydrolase [Anabaena subtropica]MBD2344973.1 alpha/beta hydrolase [Anabaena subtropica FACHB-260]
MPTLKYSIINYLCHLLFYINSFPIVLSFSGIFGSSFSLAAETIVIRYGLFEQSVAVDDIRKYEETQQVSADLASLLDYLSPKQQQKLLEVLQIKIPLDIVAMNKLVTSETGEKFLNFVALAIARSDNAGIQALRSAILLGAKAPKGLGIISFLEAYPSERIVVNLPVALEMLEKSGWLNEEIDINESCIYIIPK